MAEKQKILIVDDDENIAELISLYLIKECFDTKIVHDGEMAIVQYKDYRPNLILLDLMLPGIDGYGVCREVRKDSKVPIIMLSAKGEVFDKVLGLELGADDYLVKPFLPKELLLRVQAILKRAYPEKERVVTLNAAAVDLDRAEVIRDGQRTPLTAKEYSIFEKLAENAGRIVTIGVLCQTLCGEIWQGYETTLMTHIRHLREKIEENPSKPVSLLTVKGLGYKLVVKEPEK